MDKRKNGGFDSATEMRKQLLITQGAMFRSGLVASRAVVKSGLQGQSLARSALKQAGLAAFSFWRERPGVASLPGLAPLLLSGMAKLWRRSGEKPLVRGLAVATVVAAAAIFFLKKKRASDEQGAAGEAGEESAAASQAENAEADVAVD